MLCLCPNGRFMALVLTGKLALAMRQEEWGIYLGSERRSEAFDSLEDFSIVGDGGANCKKL